MEPQPTPARQRIKRWAIIGACGAAFFPLLAAAVCAVLVFNPKYREGAGMGLAFIGLFWVPVLGLLGAGLGALAGYIYSDINPNAPPPSNRKAPAVLLILAVGLAIFFLHAQWRARSFEPLRPIEVQGHQIPTGVKP